MNRLEIEQRILQHSQQMSDHTLLEVLHYVEFLSQKMTLKPTKRFKTMKVEQITIVPREKLHER